MKAVLGVFAIVLVPVLGAAQTTPLDSGATQMVRAAGMPLNDGALAPGMLTVRVVEGAFTRNIANQLVEVEVAGGKIESARTGADGRAQFAHLPVGAQVRARVAVGSERLESDRFPMPAESGVRVLLVAGSGAAESAHGGLTSGAGSWPAGSSPALPPNHPPLLNAAAASAPAPAPAGDNTGLAFPAVLFAATVFGFGVVLFRRPRRQT